MYIERFNCDWMGHPFLKNSLKVKNRKTIEKILAYGIHEVYIDSERGLDAAGAQTKEEAEQETRSEIESSVKAQESKNSISESDIENIVIKKKETVSEVPIGEELIRASKIQKEAKRTIQHLMQEARYGNKVKPELIDPVIDNMIDSIYRNEDALINLTRIRNADEYTYLHSVGVSVLALTFGKYIGLKSQSLKDIGIAAMLHDVGKMKIPAQILNKKGNLTESEYEIMKKHVEIGNLILSRSTDLPPTSLSFISQHHERLDGSGYPLGLKGDELSLHGQIAAIVDVYDAMTSDRCYRDRCQPSEVLKNIFEWSKFHFNSDLVQKFIRCVGIYPVGTLVRLKNGLLAVVVQNDGERILNPVVRVIYDAAREKYIMPKDILSVEENTVESCESPKKWNIRVETYL